MIDRTHDPDLISWVESANLPGADFPIQNLPWVTFRGSAGIAPRPAVAIGDQLLDLGPFGVESIAAVMAMPAAQRRELRQAISRFLATPANRAAASLTPIAAAELLLPCAIGDYTDFYASIHHATNVGSMFRPGHPLLPNYKWVPIAYHGRASSIVASGTPVRRPSGQMAPDAGGEAPLFGPTRRLDYELEVGAFLGPGNRLGEPIPIAAAFDHIVGVCLLNDWSARDVQAWEYQPLGPFLSKNFATSISPFIVSAEALEPFRRASDPRPAGDPAPLPYLSGGPDAAYDITLEVWLRSARMAQPVRISRTNFRHMYWTLAQMVAHHTCGGCNLRPGDLIASGTVSGPEKLNRGCLLELTWRGEEPLELPGGETRRFLEDGDEVILRGWCEAPGFRRIGLGECRGRVVGA